MPDLSLHICGGYYLVKRISRPAHVGGLMPATLITLSHCLTDIAPDTWAIEHYNYAQGERAAEALEFGIPAAVVPQLVALFSRDAECLQAPAFASLSTAQEFYRHCANRAEVALVGIGLHPSRMASLYTQRDKDVNRGYGLLERVELKQLLDTRGGVLGYEPLGFEATRFHSWLCHSMPDEAAEKLQIGRTTMASSPAWKTPCA